MPIKFIKSLQSYVNSVVDRRNDFHTNLMYNSHPTVLD